MAGTIPVLWSDDISVDVLSPVAILRAQARPLAEKTKGLLRADIESITSDTGRVKHQFDLIAPALGNFRRRVLTATHQKDLVYPVIVEAECFLPEYNSPISRVAARMQSASSIGPNTLPDGQRLAATDQEFIKLVGEVFRSSQVRSLIQSLIARSNDRENASESPPADPGESPE